MTDQPLSDILHETEKVYSPQDVLLGKVLAGRYKVESIIGHGGFGYVYRGTHLSLGIPIAIKVMHFHIKEDADKLRRFENEAKVLARIESPNVIRTMDYGLSPVAFIVMEFVQGQTLDKLLSETSPSALELVAVFVQVCEGLKAAHAIGLVHRDLKPTNIMISAKAEAPSVKILDFGIAKVNSDESDTNNIESKMTLTGEIMGSPAYMSPEQWMSRPIDQRSDIYSLGCVMYEAFAGRPLFHSANAFDFLNLHVNGEFEPFAKTAKVSGSKALILGLEQIVRKCTEKDPNHRYQSVVDLFDDLSKVSKGEKLNIKKQVRIKRAHAPLLICVALVLLTVVAGVAFHSDVLKWALESQVKTAQSYAKMGRTSDAISSYKTALWIAKFLPPQNISNLHALRQLAALLEKNGSFPEARQLLEARKIACGDFDDTDIAQLISKQASSIGNRQDFTKMLNSARYAEKLSIARHGKNTIQRANILRIQGIALRDSGNTKAAEVVLNEAMSLMEQLDYANEEVYARLLYAAGTTFDLQTRYGAATALYERAVKISEEKKIGEVYLLYNNLASDYYYLNRFDKAVPLMRQALDLARLYQTPALATILNNFGGLYIKMKRFDDAVNSLEEARVLNKNDDKKEVLILGNLGTAYEGAGQYQKALDTYKEYYKIRFPHKPNNPLLSAEVERRMKSLEAKIASLQSK